MRQGFRAARLGVGLVVAIVSAVVAASGAASLEGSGAPGQTRAGVCGDIRGAIDSMRLREKVGQMVMVLNAPGFGDFTDTEMLIREHNVGSVVSHAYFGLTAADAAAHNNALQRAAEETRLGIPVLNAADFEGGVTLLVAEGTDLPNQMGLGAARTRGAAAASARITASEALAMGFQWTFSPVADVVTTPLNGEIGVRSFGGRTQLVRKLTRTQVRTYQHEGLIATAKHFVGLGGSEINSHFALPRVSDDREALRRVYLPPFRAAVRAGVDAVMTGHVVVEALDPDLPASLSPEVTSGWLRQRLGYKGVVITDSMTLGAVVERWGIGEAAVLAVKAGADIVMEIGDTSVPVLAIDALVAAVESGEVSRSRIDASVKRVLKLKCEYGAFRNRYVDPETAELVVGAEEQGERAERIGRRAITLVKNEGVLPFESEDDESTLVAGVTHHATVIPTPPLSHVPAIAATVDELSSGPVKTWTAATEEPTAAEIAEAVELAQSSDRVLVATYSAGALPAGQAELVDALLATGKPVVAIALGTPYDVAQFPDVPGYVAAYAATFLPTYAYAPSALRAAVEVIFGAQPKGRLPVAIEGHYPFGHGLRYGDP